MSQSLVVNVNRKYRYVTLYEVAHPKLRANIIRKSSDIHHFIERRSRRVQCGFRKTEKNSTIKKYNKIAHKVALVSSLKFLQRIYCVVPVACECSQYNILSPIFPHGALGNKQRRGKRVQTGDSTPPLNLQYF